ncbi:SHOCT domain-containing protein [Nesterenkonia haasae]|uniref:SHOCT domain-containing protein n=1 Tax=Nesterenkonia haasae TaxID=2587813 RepID=UPI0013916608|nr:SHOCT domain-containing protein [Nesterenkonia haasae]NDK31781.1 SHOCT domain-containing protein [Nesterenkonia haasae]
MNNDATPDSGMKQGFWAKTIADGKKAAEEAKARAMQARETAGNLVTTQRFAGSTIEIYDGGYVRVAVFVSDSTPYEKLKSIKHSFQVQDKSAGGRAMVGLMTGGVNYLGSREKRTVFLTLVTERRVHTLKTTGGMGRSEDRVALGLEVAGRGVLGGLAAPALAPTLTTPAVVPAPTGEQSDVIEQIKKLGELHAAGVLSDEEFTSKKTDLLNRL